jgi:N-acetyl-gamma-glutamyl-phosphate reductase
VAVSVSPTVLSAGIAGASGYAGSELARLIAAHPGLKVTATGREAAALDGCDIALLALPHGASGPVAQELAASGTAVVDLSRDMRETWLYGLTELHRGEIAGATAVANPGCYATAAILALAPLVASGVIDEHVVVDGKSGVSGAGRAPSEATAFCQAAEGIAPYAPVGHPHQAEIEMELGRLSGNPVTVTFTPHLAPFSRGLLVTAYARLTQPLEQTDADRLYAESYAGERFVHVVDGPRTQALRGSNLCHLSVWVDTARGTVIAAAAIDNLVKGAAGQAIQNANLMLGFAEHLGLSDVTLWP